MAKAKNKLDKGRFFRALADRTRLRMLNLLGEEVCGCFLAEVLQLKRTKISHHLAYLRRAGIIAARRDGKWTHYRILPPADSTAARILSEARNWIAQDKEMQQDHRRLVKLCCSSDLPVALRGVPKPQVWHI